MPVSEAALCTRASRWKQPKCPLTDEWINKMWSIHMLENYLVIKRNEVMLHATTCIDLENICAEKQKPDTKDSILYDSLT